MGTGYDFGLGRMDLSFSVTAIGAPTGFLEIYFSQIGNPKALAPSIFWMDLEATADHGQFLYDAGYCHANMKDFMRASKIGGSPWLGPGSFDGGAFFDAGLAIHDVSAGPYYSLTQKIIIRATGEGASYSGVAGLQPVPEPASILLLGTGLAYSGWQPGAGKSKSTP